MECITNFGREITWETSNWKTKRRWKDSIRLVLENSMKVISLMAGLGVGGVEH
jgi:hypothetical protein